jgi:hypothetical protein
MASFVCSALSNCYQNYVPSFTAIHAEIVRKELTSVVESVYVGRSAYQFNGKGSDYLKSKSVFIAPNLWDLGRALVIYSAFAALGYLMFSFGLVSVGYGVMGFFGYLALGETVGSFGKNHLKKALKTIKPFESLETISFTHSAESHKITIDPALMKNNVMRGVDTEGRTKIVLFKVPSPPRATHKQLIKIYYIGSDYFVRSFETKSGIGLECNNLLSGLEIQSLLDAVKSQT